MTKIAELVVPRMPALQRLEKSLKRLDLSWKVIETTARVISPPDSVGFVATLEHTRQAFSQLSVEMVEQIAQSHLMNSLHDLEARAQVAIDILVRNLFERTADVGFIATDSALIDYVREPNEAKARKLHSRLDEYRNKYTVYDDILVLDAGAQPLLSLQSSTSGRSARPDWWGQVLANSGYVEVYGRSELFPNAGEVLLYANCIVSGAGEIIGAIVLKFDLQSELESIFRALRHPDAVICLLDARHQLVASSAAPGSFNFSGLRLPKADAAEAQLLRLQGEEYLYSHCQPRGYQGYSGPGWSALAVLRLDQAFDTARVEAQLGAAAGADSAADIDIEMENAKLQEITSRARSIEEDLNRVIWNGKLKESGMGAGAALNPLFAEIGRTSNQTIAAFEGAISELKKLLIAGKRRELAAHAALAVDIMDRNLYERANDCRWWALSDEFAGLLETLEAGPSETALQRAGEILAHLNSLYTVYQRIALFDRQGRVLAVSRDSQQLAQPCAIVPPLLQQTLALKNTQAYAVSPMQPHALADGQHTYLYCAPIRKSGHEHALGGIALAFNCRTELHAMLQDSLPVAGNVSGLFLDAAGQVLASTDSQIAIGSQSGLFGQLQPQTGAGGSAGLASAAPVCQWQLQTCLVGLAQSRGYREYKVDDGYRNDVYSVLLAPVRPSHTQRKRYVLPGYTPDLVRLSRHYGVVQCGRMLFALSSLDVIEAVSSADMAPPPAHSELAGMLQYVVNRQMAVLPVYDSCVLTGQPPITDIGRAVAIVVSAGAQTIGLLVDRLIDVVECDSMKLPPGGLNPEAPWICGYIHDALAETDPVFVLDAAGLTAGRALEASY